MTKSEKNQRVTRKSVCFGRGEVFIAYTTDLETDDLLTLHGYTCSKNFFLCFRYVCISPAEF